MRSHAPLIAVVALALALRLLVWRWHEQYPLGGDEREYLDQALALLRTRRYHDLLLMRPPLYTFFLAGCVYLFDSLTQRLRLVQALIGALTVVPVFLLARRLFGDRKVALLAGLLAALSYTLAANATELLTETLFVFGLTTLLWLLLAAVDDRRPGTNVDARRSPFDVRRSTRFASIVAGLCVGALALLRSVALPLVPLGALWLLLRPTGDRRGQPRFDALRSTLYASLAYVLAAVLVVAPWTARNYLTYGSLILVDTTGAENLWLDNNPAGATPADPLGREDAKRQLYALGDDRGARQRLALARGRAAIAGESGWFLSKTWGEAKKFFALQYFDDMRARRAIWVPPAEVWLRLLLGDGLWLALLLCGAAGLWLAPATGHRRRSDDQGGERFAKNPRPLVVGLWSSLKDPRWLFVPWALYTLLTAMLFHVELRYRLPLYPVLLPYAAWTIRWIGAGRRRSSSEGRDEGRKTEDKTDVARLPPPAGRTARRWVSTSTRVVLAGMTVLVLLVLALLHRPYLAESWMLARKHYQLWRAERALAAGDASASLSAASAALALDPDSALARVALARAEVAAGDLQAALTALDQAVAALPAHPYAHLLRGALRRQRGDQAGARGDLSFERASLEDLQGWAWRSFAPFAPAPSALDVGGGLDLGFVQGFYPPEQSFRWSAAEARILLALPGGSGARLRLRLAGGRPGGAPGASVTLLLSGREIGRLAPANAWATYDLAIPPDVGGGPAVLVLRGDTFRPRDFDRASPDARALGVMVGRVEVMTP